MTSYIDYMTVITASKLYDGLIGYGLFASKISTFLRSESFLPYMKTAKFPKRNIEKDYIGYSKIRNINVPRPLAIPNPFGDANLCDFNSTIRSQIIEHFETKTNGEITVKADRYFQIH